MAASTQGNANGFPPAPYSNSYAHRSELPSQATPTHGQTRQFGTPSGQARGPSFGVYIQNIPLDKTREDLRSLFSKFGDIYSTRVLPPKEGYSGFIGFVDFATEEQANAAVEQMSGVSLDETHTLRVSRSRQKGDQDGRGAGRQRERRSFPPSGAGGRPGDGMQEQDLFNVNGPGRGGNVNGDAFPPRRPGEHQQQHQQGSFGGSRYQQGGQFKQMAHESKPPQGGGYQQSGNSRYGAPEQNYNMPSQFNSQGGYGQQGMPAPVNSFQHQGQFDPAQGQGGYNEQGFEFNGAPGGSQYQGGYQGQAYPQPQGSFNQAPGYGNYQGGEYGSGPVQGYQGQMNPPAGQEGFHNPGNFGTAPTQGYQEQAPDQFHTQAGYGVYAAPHGQGDPNGTFPQQQHQVNGDSYQQYPDNNLVQTHGTNSGGYGMKEGGFLSQASGRLPRGANNSHSPGSQGNRTCHSCGQQGHFSRECPTKSGGGDRACHNCGEQGHFARECPNKSSADRACRKCGEEGHFARECTALGGTGDSGSGCFNCGQAGHFARECPNPATEGEKRPPPVTYIPPVVDDVNALFTDGHHSGINFDKYDNIPVQVTGKDPPPAIAMFDQAGLLEQCAANVRRANYTKPTPIQKHSIPIILSGRDLMACAQTGSGKTAAFLLPVMTSMVRKNQLSGGGAQLMGDTVYPSAVCIAPTRELALQTSLEAYKFSNGTVIKSAVCYGGVNVQNNLERLRQGAHFLVATPGRLEDFINRNRVSLENVKYLILDEADRMLDMGFEPQIRRIVEAHHMPPKNERQTLMFSATFPDEIQRLAADFLKEDYLFVAVGRVGGSNHDITQAVVRLQSDDKRDTLFDILRNSGTDRTLVFVEQKRSADFLACLLSQNNFPTTSISGDRTQYEREAALKDFRTGRAPVLVATSVAARGLDIPDVKHVINYDLPKEIDEYVHRIGRTGRIGNKGMATSFFETGRDEKMARSLVKVLSEACQEVPDWLESCAESAIGSGYGPAGGRFASRDRREPGRDYRPRQDVATVAEGVASMQVHDSPAPPRPRAGPGFNALQDDDESWD